MEKEKDKKPANFTKGPQVNKYDPDNDKGPKKFKGGAKRNQTENICKRRYQQISVTALGDLAITNSSSNSSSRILQSNVYTMTLEVGTEDFSSARVLLLSAGALLLTLFTLF